MKPLRIESMLRGLLAAVLPLLLAACLDGTTTGVGAEGTGGVASIGRVDGFGSTVVEGERFDDSAALIEVDVDAGGPVAAPLSAVKLGAQVAVQAEGGVLKRGVVAPEVIGRISVDADEASGMFMLMGQRVLLAGHPAIRPVLEGVFDLPAGTVVEVHGLRLANQDIVATRVQVRASNLDARRLSGTVANLDAATRQFTIAGATVSYANALLLPTSVALANGQRVTVFTVQDGVSGNRISARSVRIDSAVPVAAAGSRVRVSGFVTDFASPGLFRVRDQVVDARNARYLAGASSADLRNDQLLRVLGTLEGGVLRAAEIAVVRTMADAPTAIAGAMTDFSGADNVFRMRGANVRLDAATQLVGGSADNLANGVALRVSGSIVDGELRASRVDWLADSPVVAGTTASFDASARTLRLPPYAQPIRVSPSTTFRNGTEAQLGNGRRVRVSGVPGPAEFTATEVTFLDAVDAPLTIVLAGITSDGVNGRIYVNDTPVQLNAQTQVTGGPTGTANDLDGGQYVIVRAERQGTELVARSIDIRVALDDDFDNVLGYVTDFASLADLRVGGQKVNAATATITGGTAAQVRNTAHVLVEGTMNQGVLVARRLELLPN